MNSSSCRGTNRRGEPCGRRASADGYCPVHGGWLDMKAIGKLGGRRPKRAKASGDASLRQALRDEIGVGKLVAMIGAALESQSPTERASAARLIVAELSEGPKAQGWTCTCHTAPGEYCGQLEPHGYRSVPKTVGLADLLTTAIECGLVEVERGGVIVVDGKRVTRHEATPRPETAGSASQGFPSPPATLKSPEPDLAELVSDGAPQFDESADAKLARRFGRDPDAVSWPQP